MPSMLTNLHYASMRVWLKRRPARLYHAVVERDAESTGPAKT